MKAQLLTTQLLVLKHIGATGKEEMDGCEKQLAEIKAALDKTVEKYEKTITRSADRDFFEAIKAARAEYLSVMRSRSRPICWP